jgi:hypothetical protein
MAIKTFTTGEVLTAADTNTYLANSGLVYITSVTLGAGVTTVPVASAFSSTYDNYRITISNVDCSAADAPFYMTLGGSTGSTYIYSTRWNNYTTGAYGGVNSAGTTSWIIGLTCANDNTNLVLDIQSPNISNRRTAFSILGSSDTNMIFGGGQDTNLTAQTSFSIVTLGGVTMTGGTVTVFGYRKA